MLLVKVLMSWEHFTTFQNMCFVYDGSVLFFSTAVGYQHLINYNACERVIRDLAKTWVLNRRGSLIVDPVKQWGVCPWVFWLPFVAVKGPPQGLLSCH